MIGSSWLKVLGFSIAGAAAASGICLAVVVAEGASSSQEVAAPAAGGQYVYIDENGNRVARPADVPAPAVAEAEPKGFAQSKSDLEGGGWKMDVSHVRAYSHVTVDASGKVSMDCETHHGAPAATKEAN
jgi:hypothetical protein